MNNQKKIKILFVSTKSVWGGAQKYVFDLATKLDRSQFDVFVASGGDGPLTRRLKDEGIRVEKISHFAREVKLLNELKAFKELWKVVRRIRPHIVHLNGSKAGTVGAVAAKLAFVGSKTVYSTHGLPFLEERSPLQKRLLFALLRVANTFWDGIIAISRFDYQQALSTQLVPSRKLSYIPISIQPSAYTFLQRKIARARLAKKIGLKPEDVQNKFIIGTIAEYTKNKGLADLIASAEALFNSSPHDRSRTLFLLIGWGPEKKELEREIRERQLEKEVYLVSSDFDDVKYMKAFDTFVLPSVKEGLPYVLLEACLAKVPMIATNVGGNPEVVRNDTGILLSPHNPRAIAKAILSIERANKSAEERAKKAFEHVHRSFSFHVMRKTTEKLYLTLNATSSYEAHKQPRPV